jgi:CO/xanthine dehydrogenase Mo-binding subunit
VGPHPADRGDDRERGEAVTAVDRPPAPPVRTHAETRKWVGKSIRRVEDPKFLRGRGGYIADLVTPGMLHAAVLRSPHPHARIVSIDTAAAAALDGVHAVITGAQAAELTDPLPDFGPDPANHVWRCLAVDKVRYVGEGVAVVVADSRYLAEDALGLIDVEYEPLPPVVDPEAALADGAPLVHETLGTNCAYERTFDFGDVDRDFAEADVIVRDRLRWHRSGGQPLETVGAIADYDHATGELTVHTNSLSFTSYLFMAAATLKIPANKLDVRQVPAGGSFGSKLFVTKPLVIAGMCSRAVGQPVVFLEDRVDNMSNCDHHGSDRVYEVELAMMRDGTMRGLTIDTIDDYGAYIQFGVGHHGNALAQVVGPYMIGSVRYRVRAALTNKNQQGAYRGFGSEVNNWMLEQMVDKAARELDLDPVEIRRRNFIREFPHFIPTGNVYDSGDYDAVLEKALELSEYDHWRAEQAKARKEGRHIGIGLITAQERSVFSATEFWFWFDEPGAPVTSMPESVTLKVDATGGITATLYSCAFWGNSPETMVAQLVAEEFDCDPHDVAIVYQGSKNGLPATGPGGSRTTVMLAGAVEGATAKIKAKALRAAAHLMEADPDDLEWVDGGYQVKGVPEQRKSLADIAVMLHLFKHSFPDDMESGLEDSKVFDHPYTTMPSADRKDLGVFYPFMGHACHVPVVEVDVETGGVRILSYAAVHDCGTLVNPRSLAGHIVGGTAQGIGTAFYEEFVYDDDGQLLTSSYLDYLIPSAMEVPELAIGHVETPSPYTPHGIKGGGEGGRMMAPAALNAAVNDALAPLGVRLTELPMTPERILTALRAAR